MLQLNKNLSQHIMFDKKNTCYNKNIFLQSYLKIIDWYLVQTSW